MPDRLFTAEKVTQYHDFIMNHKKLVLVGGIILFILLLLFITLGSPSQPPSATQQNNPQSSKTTGAPLKSSSGTYNMIPKEQQHIFFAKSIQKESDTPPNIELYRANTDGTNVSLKGTLTDLAKQITPVDENTYYYVGNPAFLDRGDGIYIFHAKEKKSEKIITPSDGFGIESFMLIPSAYKPDGIIYWEQTIGAVENGTSQITYVSLANPSNKKALLSEAFSDQTKYPLFYSDYTKLLYLDSYSVNRNGKNRGMFTLSLDGKLSPIPSLGLNLYSSEPHLSLDGKRIVFTSYTQEARVRIPAPNVPNQLLREQVRNPNQVKLLDLTTGTVTLLTQNLDGRLYENPVFSQDGKYIVYKKLIIEDSVASSDTYALLSMSDKKETPYGNNPNGIMLYVFSDASSVFGMRTLILDSSGGGENIYNSLLEGIYLYDNNSRSYTKILSDEPVSFLGIL